MSAIAQDGQSTILAEEENCAADTSDADTHLDVSWCFVQQGAGPTGPAVSSRLLACWLQGRLEARQEMSFLFLPALCGSAINHKSYMSCAQLLAGCAKRCIQLKQFRCLLTAKCKFALIPLPSQCLPLVGLSLLHGCWLSLLPLVHSPAGLLPTPAAPHDPHWALQQGGCFNKPLQHVSWGNQDLATLTADV